ncbi:hypothetical protein TD95_002250 [Thielaviopsis punctulata]|uniref:PHD-type domain-containing protein n=1 Tax=Thielaviopsis punctulata TaxID=72032 RepID=A0A0F4ZD63_9PEZI|nr:hypothetical protein TD95_002250 [Thielaviopsis punctulata]
MNDLSDHNLDDFDNANSKIPDSDIDMNAMKLNGGDNFEYDTERLLPEVPLALANEAMNVDASSIPEMLGPSEITAEEVEAVQPLEASHDTLNEAPGVTRLDPTNSLGANQNIHSDVDEGSLIPLRSNPSEEVMAIEDQESEPDERVLTDGSILVKRNAPTPSNFEIVLSGPPENVEEYLELMPDYIQHIVSTSMDENGDRWFEVQYLDGRHKMPSDVFDERDSSQQPLRQSSIRDFVHPTRTASREGSKTSDTNEKQGGRSRTTMRQSIGVSHTESSDDELAYDTGGPARKHRLRKTATITTGYLSSENEEGSLLLVRSDIAPSVPGSQGPRKSLRPRRQKSNAQTRLSHDSDIELEAEEPYRRSARTTKNSRSMKENDAMDPESFYIDDNQAPAQPRTIVVKELFKELSETLPFSQRHMQFCDSCKQGTGNGRGILVYCQGCSLSFHQMCLGSRSSREHWATKIGEGDFVLQCRFCIGRTQIKDQLAPCMSTCQGCFQPGKSCAYFSPRRTPKQEQKIREQNGGVDPIVPVDPSLINNVDNVLFRCTKCHRTWHPEHLPPMTSKSSALPNERLKEYMEHWRCYECTKYTAKVNGLVAWRLAKDEAEVALADKSLVKKRTRPEDTEIFVPIDGYPEDQKQYLIKWEHLSYHHVTWMPGAWVYNVVAASSKKAFRKRCYAQYLYKKTAAEAVPEEYLHVDIIFNVKYQPNTPPAKTLEEDMDRIAEISEIYYKPQGLPYSEAVWDAPPDDSSLDIYHSFIVAYQQFLCGKYFEHEPHVHMKKRISKFKQKPFEEVILSSQPPGLKGKLMDYQINGVNWMLRRYHKGNNAILADEMGLGKTVQVISLITTLVQEEPRVWPFLIVVPNSTCPNWRREIKQWSPELRVVTYYGGKDAQNMAYNFELFTSGRASEMKAHVVVMAYESAQDGETLSRFRQIHWAGIVVDEGQRLKNDKNLLYCALGSMRPTFRLLLTGTPLQNNKRELFNLLQFVDSKYDAETLDAEYRELTNEKILELHQLINPYFYRRTKAGVLKFLPPMSQIIVPVSMTVVQEKLCKSIMAKNPQLIQAIFRNTPLKIKERGSLSNILMQLRKCLCHPFLYSDAIEERNDDPEISHRNLIEASGKLILLEALLTRLKEQGHRVLIFSQFLGQLDIIGDFLSGMGMLSARIDGSCSTLERQRSIDRFNAPGSKLFAFLLSTRAGGVGINLATADTVIIMDPDFNPHQDLQALSRAHRIGQRNKVLCLQLMTKDSVEEKIMQMGKKKMALDHALIERMGATADGGKDLESILKHGAEALFTEGKDKERIHYDAAAIEKLLDRSFTKEDHDTSPEAEFTYGKVWSNEGGGQIQDSLGLMGQNSSEAVSSSVWESILAQREAEAAQEAEAKKEILGRGGRTRRAVNYKTNGSAVVKDAGPQSDIDMEQQSVADPDFNGDLQGGKDAKEDIEEASKSDEDFDDDLEFWEAGGKKRHKNRGLVATLGKAAKSLKSTAGATPASAFAEGTPVSTADESNFKPKRKYRRRKSTAVAAASVTNTFSPASGSDA